MEQNDNKCNLIHKAMVNPHLRRLEYVVGLAQAEADRTKENQAIYKTKDQQKYEIFYFMAEKNFKGNAVRVVRYARNIADEVVLQDSGNEQSVVVSEEPRISKRKSRREDK